MQNLERTLNHLLADHVALMHKVQAYHWLVTGPEFFATHALMEGHYERLAESIDEIAEKTLMIGGTPIVSMREFLAEATIPEAQARYLGSDEVIRGLLGGYESLLGDAVGLRAEAEAEGSTNGALIGAFADELIAGLSKETWMLRQAASG